MPDVSNDWNQVRFDLDKSANFQALCNSPWYTDAVYEKFSDAEFARRHALARQLMERDGLDALILCGSPNIYSHGSGVTWGCGLIDARGMAQYMLLPRQGEPTLIYPHPGATSRPPAKWCRSATCAAASTGTTAERSRSVSRN